MTHAFLLPDAWAKQSLEDSGLTSYLTILLAGLALVITLRNTTNLEYRSFRFSFYAVAYVILIYALREADFHRMFTDEHITRAKFYTNSSISFTEKILGGIPLLLFFFTMLFLIGSYGKLLYTHIKQRHAWAIATVLWGGLLFLSQIIDRSGFNRTKYGQITEETLELCASGYALLAVFFGFQLLRVRMINK